MVIPIREIFDFPLLSQDEGQRSTESPLSSANGPRGAWVGVLVKPVKSMTPIHDARHRLRWTFKSCGKTRYVVVHPDRVVYENSVTRLVNVLSYMWSTVLCSRRSHKSESVTEASGATKNNYDGIAISAPLM